jgi:hypothetical protein
MHDFLVLEIARSLLTLKQYLVERFKRLGFGLDKTLLQPTNPTNQTDMHA